MKVLFIYPRGSDNTYISNNEVEMKVVTDEQAKSFEVILEDIRYGKKITEEIQANSTTLTHTVDIDLLGDNLLWKWYYRIKDTNDNITETEHHYFKLNDGIYVNIPHYFKEDTDFCKPIFDGIHDTDMAFIQRIMQEYLNYTIKECDLTTLAKYEKDYGVSEINKNKPELERRGALISLKRGKGAMTVDKIKNIINAYSPEYILTEDYERYKLSIKFRNGIVSLDFLHPLKSTLIDTLPAHLLIEMGSTRDYNYKVQISKVNYIIQFQLCGETNLCNDGLGLFN